MAGDERLFAVVDRSRERQTEKRDQHYRDDDDRGRNLAGEYAGDGVEMERGVFGVRVAEILIGDQGRCGEEARGQHQREEYQQPYTVRLVAGAEGPQRGHPITVAPR